MGGVAVALVVGSQCPGFLVRRVLLVARVGIAQPLQPGIHCCAVVGRTGDKHREQHGSEQT